MNFDHLLKVLKGGNVALGRKLDGLLTEDCQIIEYTDDSVLFTKDNNLVLAKIRHNVNESVLTSDDVLDNEVIYISKRDLEAGLCESLTKSIANLAEDNLVDANIELDAFCEKYYQYGVLKHAYPNLFVEALAPQARGFSIRKKGYDLIPKFKGAIFSASALSESANIDAVALLECVSKYGQVLALGKDVVKHVVTSTIANETLAESIVNTLFEMAHDLPEANDDLKDVMDKGYDLDGGSYPGEDTAEEDYMEPDTMDQPEDSGMSDAPEFEPFDPASLTPEEKQQLHVDTMKSILMTIRDFVTTKANDVNSTMDPSLDGRIGSDIESLEDPEVSADILSDIEARWSPVIDSFLDSDMYADADDEFALPAEPTASDEATDVDDVGVGEEQPTASEPPMPGESDELNFDEPVQL